MTNITAETATFLLVEIKNPDRNDAPDGTCGWMSKRGLVGASYHRPSDAYEDGCIKLDFALEEDGDECRYEFEPDSRPWNWRECWKEVRNELRKIALELDEVASGSLTRPLGGGLRFVADNPKGGTRDVYQPKVKLSPDGTP